MMLDSCRAEEQEIEEEHAPTHPKQKMQAGLRSGLGLEGFQLGATCSKLLELWLCPSSDDITFNPSMLT